MRIVIAAMIAAFGVVAAMEASFGASPAIRIGEVNSYSNLSAFTKPYRNGWRLALKDISTLRAA